MCKNVTKLSSIATAEALVNSRRIGILCGFAIVCLFSGFTLVSRMGFASSLKVMDIAALRFVTAGIVMLPLLLKYGLTVQEGQEKVRKARGRIRLHEAAALALSGGLGFAMLAYTGFSLAPASHAAVLLHGSLPLFSSLLAYTLLPASLSMRRKLGLLIIALGIAAMAYDSLINASMRQLLGDAALLSASICWSAYGLLAQKLELRPAHTAAIVAVCSMFCYLPLYLMLPGKALLLANWREILVQALFQGVMIGVLSIYIYSQAVARLGALETALYTAAVPCVTTLAAVFFLAEIPGLLVQGGVLIVTAGMLLAMKN
ncbi:DMT family transporter [Undibacterium sp. TJN19]|uniref:DMT family transporter n=1 Tax=Undibacterium sp. TJN19 TaxID=3413055 RepID=UPI003BF022F0